MRDRVGPMIEKWAQQDYPVAGEWLATAPEGPARETAILAYAAAIYTHDSEAALEWVRTLPDGEERLRALQRDGGL